MGSERCSWKREVQEDVGGEMRGRLDGDGVRQRTRASDIGAILRFFFSHYFRRKGWLTLYLLLS